MFWRKMDEGEEMDVETPKSTVNKTTSTLLHIAVRRSDYKSAQEFLDEMGYDVNARDSDDNTPLHIAAECESIDILNMLLDKGALVNAQNNRGETALHKAATSTMSEMVESLLRSGGSVNTYNKESFTPFHVAVTKGYKKVIELMLDWGADIHLEASKEQTPLHIAVTHWNSILAEILLDRGAEVNSRDSQGKTPLHVAVERVDMTMVELLIKRSADMNAPDYDGQTPLHLAANHWNYRVAKLLLDRPSLINSQNNKGQTPLHIAVGNGDLTLVNTLLDRGALTDTYDRQRLTPLHYAVKNDYAKVMLKLIEKAADVTVLAEDPNYLRYLKNSPCSGPLLHVHISKVKWAQPADVISTEIPNENRELKSLCVQELENIKSKKVIDVFGNEYLLTHIFDKRKHFNAELCKSFEAVLGRASILDTDFPLYAFVLRVSLLRMKKRHILIRAAEIFFTIHNFFDRSVRSHEYKTLPHHINEIILRLLSDVDLQNLIVVTENSLRIRNHFPW